MILRKSMALVVAAAVLAVVGVVVWRVSTSSPKNQALEARELAMEMLGARIAKLRPNAKVLVLTNPFTKDSGHFNEKNQFERAGIRGLGKGLGGRASVKPVFPEVRPEYYTRPESLFVPPDCRTPLSFLIRPESVVELAEANPEFRVIVSLIGLPVGTEGLKVWEEKDPRCFALLLPDLRLLGTSEDVATAFRREKLLAAVVEDARTGAPLVVTSDNLAEVMERQPKSLGF